MNPKGQGILRLAGWVDMAADKDILKDAQEAFKQATDAEADNRERALDDIKFARLGEQWPANVKKDRDLTGRPCMTFNRMPSFIRQVVNDSRMNRPAIKVHPVDSGADPQTAEILNGLIRNIEVSSNADVAYDTAIDFAVAGGFGYIRVGVDYACDDGFDLDLKIERVSNPFSVYGDPYSEAADSSDWNVAFVTDMLKKDEFKKQYPKAEATDFEADNDQRDQMWFQDDTIRVAEYWTREEVPLTVLLLSNGDVFSEEDYLKVKDILDVQGITVQQSRQSKTHKVTQRIITAAEVLSTTAWKGKYIPIIPVYGDEVIVEGRRHYFSLIHPAKDAQTAYNYWRTSAIEKVALDTKSPWIGPKGAFRTDAEKWATANVKNHAYIEYDGATPPSRTPPGGVPAGDLQLALQASDDMKSIMGIYDASLGARSNETSGRAIMARQREGDVSTFHFIDNLSRAIRHTGRVLIDLIPKVYGTPRIIRTLKEDNTPGMVPVNQEAMIAGIPKVFNLTTGKYDVTVSSGPSFGTKREEAATQMFELLRAFPQAAPVIGDLLAKNLDWPGADEIAKRLQAMLPPVVQGQNPAVQQVKQQMDQMLDQGKQMMAKMGQDLQSANEQVQMLQLQLKDKAAATTIDAEKIRIEAYRAETERMKVEIAAAQAQLESMPTPEPVSADPSQLLAQIQSVSGAVFDMAQTMQQIQAIQQAIAQSPIPNVGKPTVKRAKAVKQPDGSWVMESVEIPQNDA